ncbi:Very-short-patch-repair endonuclease [Propionibacterium cyclohexanicum]|uniref:Very-short-patch-repair endonuclease n=1 Tax=Propionibacterium cyclohexanicum TaxID=64702 RepID=A0A1H9RPN6_9ACTN|nr:DUF559 domain-containing protein [Propionibacterium cyclohexanicum]SER74666.1 Very-short-patch-repair endonuclease [Propionibacterium cyclohexanicum]
MNPQLQQILAEHGVVVRRSWPALRSAITRAAAAGELETIMPGVYVEAGASGDWRRRALAACVRHPDATVTGRAAAALSFWPGCQVGDVEVSRRTRTVETRGFSWLRRVVPSEWVVDRGGLRFAHPSWAAVELCSTMGGEPLDEALRAGVKLDDLWEAHRHMGGRRGAPVRELLLRDSRDEPWSEGERACHHLLRSHHIIGWRTNVRVDGYYIDVAWKELKVGLEIDGYRFHSDRAAFEADRIRDQRLQARGWIIMHVTWRQCVESPEETVQLLKRVLRARRLGRACQK